MKTWSSYAAAAFLVLLAGSGGGALLWPEHAGAFVFAALVALAVQLLAFALLMGLRGSPRLLLAGWVGGVALRMTALVAAGLWLVNGGPYPARPALLAMVAALTVLALIEPLALRRTAKPTGSVR